MDWNEIKTAYITDSTLSYRELSERYGVPFSTLSKRAKQENWRALRRKTCEKTAAKIVSRVSDRQADRAARMQSVADRMLDKIEAAIEALEPGEQKGIQQLAGALKTVKEIQSIRSDLDIREQEARIEALRRRAGEEENGGIVIRIVDDVEEYSE